MNLLKKIVSLFGYVLEKKTKTVDEEKEFADIYAICKDFTMTSKERMYALYTAVNYIIKYNIKGDFVECGVWRGGSSMLIALTLLKNNCTDRKIYLYDTFEGMSEPTIDDYKQSNRVQLAIEKWKKLEKKNYNKWCYASIEEVKSNMNSTSFPMKNIEFIKGKVEDTIPKHIPSTISLLRLDTDWYESTKHELDHLFPKVIKNGVLIFDDYGSWAGAKKAVDEYFSEIPILLHRIDYTGRISLKSFTD